MRFLQLSCVTLALAAAVSAIGCASFADLSVGRSVGEVLRVLDALQTDELPPLQLDQGTRDAQRLIRRHSSRRVAVRGSFNANRGTFELTRQ